MPDHIQARTDSMPPAKRNRHKFLTTLILLAIIVGILALIAFG